MNCELSNLIVRGYDFKDGINYEKILQSYFSTGFQSTNFGKAIEEIEKMIECRERCLHEDEKDVYEEDEFIRRKKNCTIFLGYETQYAYGDASASIKFLVQNGMVDCLVTTPGCVEEEILRYLRCRKQCTKRSATERKVDDDKRIFSQWIFGVFDEMLFEQKRKNVIWTPSTMLTRIGRSINNEDSILSWAATRKIPIFCPEITNGFLLREAFISQPSLILDILGDLRRINSMAMKALNSAIISIGSGVVKHHMCKANCVRDGADYAFYINETLEYDGSDSGANPDESVACGKIKVTANPVKIHSNANIIFPLIVAQTFAKYLLISPSSSSSGEST